MLSVWRLVATFWTYLFMRLHMYRAKSWVHRRIFDAKYDGTPVSTYTSLRTLAQWIAEQQWVADSWDSLFDAVCTPNKVQAVGQNGNHQIGDCDEFAIYLSNAVTKSLLTGTMSEEGLVTAHFLTITWLQGWAPGGHNVCLLEYRSTAQGKTWWAYMDYGMPSTLQPDKKMVVQDVLSRYAPDSALLVWAVASPALVPMETHWGAQ